MYLKSIEVHGFKSFANKIVFDFHNGITGIVGPNGSGKSNVADAVRWVLGEQSAKQLRGANMQDVIFAGTENRKPLSYAYVAITLDNSDHVLGIDYNEVTISRRVYRSGESEYLINGSSCRLKDVNELFYDTGIGKEGYSIIGQGQIEKILNGKPEERRELFDEAAGIVKYKRRKAATQKKLEDERENLVRVNDILSELERQVGPLEKQAQTARIFLQKKEELKRYDLNLFLLESQRIEEQLTSVNEKFHITNQQTEHVKKDFDKMKASFEEMEHTIESFEHSIGDTKDKLSQLSLQKSEVLSEIRLMEEQVLMADQSKQEFQTRITVLKQDIIEKETEKENLNLEKQTLEEQLLEMELNSKQAREELQLIQKEMEDSKNKIGKGQQESIELLNKKASLNAEQQKFSAMLEQIQIRKAQLTQRLLQRKAEAQDNEVQIEEKQKELLLIQQEMEAFQTQLKDKEDTIAQLSEQISFERQKYEKLRMEAQKEQTKLESLRNIAERYDGYGNSIRKVMEQKANNSGIIGVVADLIKVEKKYETAIEIALSGNIQNIVTKDEQVAKEMIAYLKENKFGRATFLPLTSVSGKDQSKNEKFLQEPGVLGFANSLVETKAEYSHIMEYLLGRVLVVDEVDHAISLAKKSHYALHLVTLEGEYFSPGGSMAGGSYRNSSNLLGRKREIESLEQSIEKAKQDEALSDEKVKEYVIQRTNLRETLEQLKAIISQKKLSENTISVHLSKLKEYQAENHTVYANLISESKELDSQIEESKESILQIKESLEEMQKRENQIELDNSKVQEMLLLQQEKSQDFVSNTAKMQLEEANVKQKVDFVKQNIERIQVEIAKYQTQIQDISLQLEESGQHTNEKAVQIEEKKKAVLDSEQLKLTLQEQLEENQKKKEELSLEYKGFFAKREELMEQISQLDKELFRLGSQKEKMEQAQEYQISHLWEEYEITPNYAKEFADETLGTLSDIRRQIQTIKEVIKNLGNVNVNAIDDFKEMNERYIFLKTQHDDLIEAEKTLLQIIEELDIGMRQQFSEKFLEIQKEFDHVFKEMFGGGKGTLELIEDEDILECGIRIIAQPPGKKLQNMMQLSGGEKSLTAIALLFAIQNLKPSPFCLLDEIEAALDDSNVDRFAKYLHKLSSNTQFIVITHRRGTMNSADRLYGITMQEKGVSTLVSVNLIESELDK